MVMADETMNRTVVVQGSGKSLRQDVAIGPFKLVGDGPAMYGGRDEGPNPYDYLLTSLGICTSQTITGYAQQHGMPLEGVRVSLTHKSIYAEDCKDCHTKKGNIEQLTREIELSGPLSEEQRQVLLDAARFCPVSQILTHEIKIETRLVAGAGVAATATGSGDARHTTA
jgi:uncharacterized OsmC-like protein